MGRLSDEALNPVFAPIRELPSSSLQAPLEVTSRRELLVNNEKFPTGQAAGFSNGVKVEGRMGLALPPLIFIYSLSIPSSISSFSHPC
jgi:hypothetical protein